MKSITGAYASAKVFSTNNPETALEQSSINQIKFICDNEVSKGSNICIMPDVHPGKLGPIGLSMTISSQVMPSLMGIDIGCGMTIAKLENTRLEYQKLDRVIHNKIPAGFSIRNEIHYLSDDFDFSPLFCHKNIDTDRALRSLGTLGGGNHFIEVDCDDAGALWVIIHSGSRHLGKEVAEFYLKAGQKSLKAKNISLPYECTYLEDELKDNYLSDVILIQEFAELNRLIILEELIKYMKLKVSSIHSKCHNFIEHDSSPYILHKGSISAKTDEFVIIPINMRDGVILGKGLGNEEWNHSAPHGAGRIFNRQNCRNSHTLTEFKKSMEGIFCSCISRETIDESPFAYRNISEIAEAVHDTVEITDILKPVYNFKAGSK